MADTIDCGIDLGTTNSAIAVVEHGEVVVVKNNDGWDITPSAVWMPTPNETYVGRPAKARVETDPENAAAEFKQEMGLAGAQRRFANAGVALTPPQLSAEVLRSLRGDAAEHCEVPPDCAVITVPAAFTLNQNKATSEAAALAGFGAACPLVQEPTAAAFAYGFNDRVDEAYFMVFDFGGGTFDAAVVSKRDSELRVLNHAGDPYLGGKVIDWAVVDQVLAPQAGQALGLRDFRRDNPKWRHAFGALKGAAETAKIRLSRADHVTINVELPIGGGKEETFECVLRREEMDAAAEPSYLRAINLCRKALAESALDPGDIDRLLLVGGVTLAPGLRERLRDPSTGMGIKLDTSVDPTTVVARGAAIFASTVRRPEPALPAPSAGEFTVELTHEPTSTTRSAVVTGTLHGSGSIDWTGYRLVLSNPSGKPPFRSAEITPNAKGAFYTEVDLDPYETSTFTIELTDSAGNRCAVTPGNVSIRHRKGPDWEGVRLARSLGIQLADRGFAPLLRKGTPLPSKSREVFRTASALRRNDKDAVIRIPVVQGERERGDRNQQVGVLEIRPTDIRIDLPASSEVEIMFEVDASGLVTVVADVPNIDAQFEASVDTDNVRPPSAEDLTIQLTAAEDRLAGLRGTAATAGSADANGRLSRIEDEGTLRTVRDLVATSKVDVGAAAAADERLRDLLMELDDVEDAVGLPAATAELRSMLDTAAEQVKRAGQPADRQELSNLQRRAEDVIRSQDVTAVREQIELTGRFLLELERRSPDWPIKVFYMLEDLLRGTRDAEPLLREGKRAIAARDARELEAVNQRLVRLLPQEEQSKIIGVQRG